MDVEITDNDVKKHPRKNRNDLKYSQVIGSIASRKIIPKEIIKKGMVK